MPQLKKNKIGILGGTFDPVHSGHLAIAQRAFDHFLLDKIFFIPAHIPPHKFSTISVSAEHRLAMLQKAVYCNKSFEVWDGEITRGGVSYTIDTLSNLKKDLPDSSFYFIIGSDNIVEILSWYKYKTILKTVTLCVSHRPGYSMKIPEELKKANIDIFPSPEWGISSKIIRKYLSCNISCKYLLPESVYTYIKKKGLYKTGTLCL
ncbi:MAG: nicotinate-nucleotide adenylyltransferase [Chitinispirillia bacterium]|jgi:nicotinate-nucleotide adenylyltransferase